MKALFLIVKRTNKNELKVQYTNDLAKAICLQASLFYNEPMDVVTSRITEDDISHIVKNLEEELIDCVKTDEQEVYILFFPPTE